MIETHQGCLFSSYLLKQWITSIEDWRALSDNDTAELARKLTAIFASCPTKHSPNESQTEDDLIWKVLACLGWTSHLRQQNLAPRGTPVLTAPKVPIHDFLGARSLIARSEGAIAFLRFTPFERLLGRLGAAPRESDDQSGVAGAHSTRQATRRDSCRFVR